MYAEVLHLLRNLEKLPNEINHLILDDIEKLKLWGLFVAADGIFDTQKLLLAYLIHDITISEFNYLYYGDHTINVFEFVSLVKQFNVYPEKLKIKDMSNFVILFNNFNQIFNNCKYIYLDTKCHENSDLEIFSDVIDQHDLKNFKDMRVSYTNPIVKTSIPKCIQNFKMHHLHHTYVQHDIQCLAGSNLSSLDIGIGITCNDFQYFPISLTDLKLWDVDMGHQAHPLPSNLKSFDIMSVSNSFSDAQLPPLKYLERLKSSAKLSSLKKLGLFSPSLIHFWSDDYDIEREFHLLKNCQNLKTIRLRHDYLPCGLFENSKDFPRVVSVSLCDHIYCYENDYADFEENEIRDEIHNENIYFPASTKSIEIEFAEINLGLLHYPQNLTSLSVRCFHYQGEIEIPNTVRKLRLEIELRTLKNIKFPTNLEVCDLSGNELTTISDSNLMELKNLRVLGLAYNNFKEKIDNSCFASKDVNIKWDDEVHESYNELRWETFVLGCMELE